MYQLRQCDQIESVEWMACYFFEGRCLIPQEVYNMAHGAFMASHGGGPAEAFYHFIADAYGGDL